ncbi:S8 family serine peptidase [Flavobacterium beibuense]|uniref:Peptidase S8 and S53 subtilisin kexin sedolisin n=1 Tax=Flavobacterium beibuense TaxID=657326 RepID=A0A444W8C7_9FLAO|nr:S8 family serine peptidase [Flavobacterium beibuense]RYJ42130.1 Peptidase S8 and S53 subtilisin kexin sedolisin [Flavobacterium beibuense]
MKKNTLSAFLLLSLGFAGLTANAQSNPELRAKIIAQYDQAEISRVRAELQDYNEKNYNRALELAKVNGWPLVVKDKNGGNCYLSGVTKNDEPLYKGNDNNYGPSSSAITARVNHLRAGGSLGLDLQGQGMTVGMWEIRGPLTTHEQLVGRITPGDQVAFSSSSSAALNESGHATHVAGTLIGSGNGDITAMGMAPQANLLAYDSYLDNDEALAAATNPNIMLLISNHSYGFKVGTVPAWLQGAYSLESRQWDEVMHAAPYYQAVISAGNDREGANTNDLLIGNKVSKNAIVVAAVEGVANYNIAGDVDMSEFSSWGPTDDGRIKPDISMKGVAVHSSYPVFSEDNSSIISGYVKLQGTSMASPGVAGTLLLWQQYYSELNGEFMRAATLKALMINSADEAGSFPGPDQKFGWGLINAKRAIETINANGETSIIDGDLVLNPGETYTRNIMVEGNQDLRVTVVWTDPAWIDIAVDENDNNDSTSKLVNDLDVRVQGEGDIFPSLPWVLGDFLALGAVKGDNDKDNVEDILISQNEITPGVYTITVTHKGTLAQAQRFSLVVNAVTDEFNVRDSKYNSVSVYPNPATDVVNIKLGSGVQGTEGSVVMYDLQGRIVRQFNSLVDKVDVSSLNSGMYILNIEYDGYTESKKIMVK